MALGDAVWVMAVLPLPVRMVILTEVICAEQEITPRTGKEDAFSIRPEFSLG